MLVKTAAYTRIRLRFENVGSEEDEYSHHKE